MTSTVPAGPSGVLAELESAGPAQLPLRNQSTTTLPVGIGWPGPPLTVTKSCTVVPAGTVVTTLCPASWICVEVVDGNCCTIVCEPAPTVGGLLTQLLLPVFAGSSHLSCQVR